MGKLSGIVCITLAFLAAVYAQPSGRIVGGLDAKEGQFPHQISLRHSGSHICGGAIISPNFILTAAHCVGAADANGVYQVSDAKFYSIRAGSTHRLMGGVVKQVKAIQVHEAYGNFINDVALLELDSPLVYSANVQPIALAASEVQPGTAVVISGWGRLKTNGDIPIKLQYNTLESISKLKCFSSIFMSSDALICLAHTEGNGACNGDSGGPAIYNGELVGVAGFVVGGCGSSKPDGYAKVSYHFDWIKKHADL